MLINKLPTVVFYVFIVLGISSCGKMLEEIDTTDANSDGDTDADSDSDSDSDADTDADTDSDSDADTDGDSDADTDGDTDADTDADGDTDADTDADGDTDADTDADGDTDADTDSDTDTSGTCDPDACVTSGPCRACNANGICALVAAGAVDPSGTCEATDDTLPCGATGNCTAQGECEYKLQPDDECRTVCDDADGSGSVTIYACNNAHECATSVSTTDCTEGDLSCISNTQCIDPCATDDECDTGTQFCCTQDNVDGSWCAASLVGNCVPKLVAGASTPAGSSEGTEDRCATGYLYDGVCCIDEDGCAGECQSCGGIGGTCRMYNDISGLSSGSICSTCMGCNGEDTVCVVIPVNEDWKGNCDEDADPCGTTDHCNGDEIAPECAYKLNVDDECGDAECIPGTPYATSYTYTCSATHQCATNPVSCEEGYGCAGSECTQMTGCENSSADDSNCVEGSFFCCYSDDVVAGTCTDAGVCESLLTGGSNCNRNPQCQPEGVATEGYCADGVCCNSPCDGECANCSGDIVDGTAGTCIEGAAANGWTDPDFCQSAAVCAEQCNTVGDCEVIPFDDNCEINCSLYSFYGTLDNDGYDQVTNCYAATGVRNTNTLNNNCSGLNFCADIDELCTHTEITLANVSTLSDQGAANLCEIWDTECSGWRNDVPFALAASGGETCSDVPWAECSVSAVCETMEAPRPVWPESGRNIWAVDLNKNGSFEYEEGEFPLAGQKFVFESVLGSSFELGGTTVTPTYRIEFSDKQDEWNNMYVLEDCSTSDNAFSGMVVCTNGWENGSAFAPKAEDFYYIYWRAVQEYTYNNETVIQSSVAWPIRIQPPNDVDRDGFSDLLVGMKTDDATLFLGKSLITAGPQIARSAANVVLKFETDTANRRRVHMLGDVTGDGIQDFAVSYHYRSAPQFFVVSGRQNFSEAELGMANDSQSFSINIPGTVNPSTSAPDASYNDKSFGVSATGVDLNQDGIEDLVIGQHSKGSSDYTGWVYVFYGPIDSDRNCSLTATSGGPDLIITGAMGNEHLGVSVAEAGDINGDGALDLLIGAAGQSRAYVMLGGDYLPAFSTSMYNVSTVSVVAINLFSTSLTGALTAAKGFDLNRDGYGDMLFSVPDYDSGFASGDTDANGASLAVLGNPGWSGNIPISNDNGAKVIFIPTVCNGCIRENGLGLTAGNFDENMEIDLVSSAPSDAAYGGSVYIDRDFIDGVMTQTVELESSSDSILRGENADVYYAFGKYIANIGDFDGDGKDDLAVSDVINGTGGLGKVYLYRGAGIAIDNPHDNQIEIAGDHDANSQFGVSIGTTISPSPRSWTDLENETRE